MATSAEMTTARPMTRGPPRVSSEKLIALSYPLIENMAVARAAMTAPAATVSSDVPEATTGSVRIVNGCVQWVSPTVARRTSTATSIARKIPMRMAPTLILSSARTVTTAIPMAEERLTGIAGLSAWR